MRRGKRKRREEKRFQSQTQRKKVFGERSACLLSMALLPPPSTAAMITTRMLKMVTLEKQRERARFFACLFCSPCYVRDLLHAVPEQSQLRGSAELQHELATSLFFLFLFWFLCVPLPRAVLAVSMIFLHAAVRWSSLIAWQREEDAARLSSLTGPLSVCLPLPGRVGFMIFIRAVSCWSSLSCVAVRTCELITAIRQPYSSARKSSMKAGEGHEAWAERWEARDGSPGDGSLGRKLGTEAWDGSLGGQKRRPPRAERRERGGLLLFLLVVSHWFPFPSYLLLFLSLFTSLFLSAFSLSSMKTRAGRGGLKGQKGEGHGFFSSSLSFFILTAFPSSPPGCFSSSSSCLSRNSACLFSVRLSFVVVDTSL